MAVVWGDDRDDVEAVLVGSFPLGHLTVVVVHAVDAEAFGELGRWRTGSRPKMPAARTYWLSSHMAWR